MKKLLVLFFISFKCHAYSVSPMSADFKPDKGETSQVYTITNTEDQPLSIEVHIETRRHETDGKEINEKSEQIKSLFSIFPKAALIPPKQKKGIRVIYLGPKNIESETAYRVIISQRPSPEALKTGGVKMLQEFKTAAYVAPKNAKSKIQLLKTEALGRALKLTFKNDGNTHQIVKKMTLKVSDELGNVATFDQGQKEQFLVNFLSGEERFLIVERPEILKGKVLKTTIEQIE